MLHQIVPFARAELGGDRGRHFGGVDMVDRHIDIVRFAPGLRERIEPGVVCRDEVTPLQDLEARS